MLGWVGVDHPVHHYQIQPLRVRRVCGFARSVSTITSKWRRITTASRIVLFAPRVATRPRMSGGHKHATVPEHIASSHRRYAGRTIERIRKDAAAIGPAIVALRNLILD